MPDYKEMYFKMFRASEQAKNILIVAQRECEEIYMSDSEPEIEIVSRIMGNGKSKGGE